MDGKSSFNTSTDIWFTLPLVDAGVDNFTHPGQELHSLPVDSSEGVTHLYEDAGMFYLSFDKKTRQTRILYSSAIPAGQKLASACDNAEELGVRDDPFTFVTCALSSILQDQGMNAHSFSALISKMVSILSIRLAVSNMRGCRKITAIHSGLRLQRMKRQK